jgi:hypothetical protein
MNTVYIHEIIQTVGAHEIEGRDRADRIRPRFAGSPR